MLAPLFGLLLQAVGPASAHDLGFVTARELADRCGGDSAADISYCFGFVTGVHDSMRAYEIWLGEKEFCATADITQGEIRRAFLTYLSVHPDAGQGQAASVVTIALKTTFPC